MDLPILFAIGWLEIAIVLFFLISSVVSRILQAAQAQRQRGGDRKPLDVPPVGERGDKRPAGESMQQKLEKEIEAFLRKASGQPAEKPGPPPEAARRNAPPVPPQPRPKPQTLATPSPAKSRRPRRPAEREREQLAKNIESADERIESHLHQVFDHRLGSLGADTTDTTIREGTDAAVWQDAEMDQGVDRPLAEKVFELLSSPQQMRTAVVLNEILKRPEDPWRDQDR